MISGTFSQHIDVDDAPSGAIASEEDIIMTRTGQVGLVYTNLKGVVHNNCFKVIFSRDRFDKYFAYYFLKGPLVQHFIDSSTSGSVQRDLTHRLFNYCPFFEPPLKEQLNIGILLKSLDDKIELNRRMNETLEELARTIFKSWFVDFDPVKAKAEGRKPVGMDAETAALFPSRFVESELGMIPEGWEVSSLGAMCERSGGDIQTGPFGSQLHASDYVADGVPSVMPKDLKEDRISQADVARITEEDAQRLSRYRLRTGDIVYSRRGDVERCALVTFREDGWLCGTGCLRVRSGHRGLEPVYVFAAVTTSQARSWVVRHAHGATMPNLNTQILGLLPLIEPPHVVQAAYRNIAATGQNRRDQNWSQNETLSKLRDSLLPKLISGELRVPDAEKLAEAVL